MARQKRRRGVGCVDGDDRPTSRQNVRTKYHILLGLPVALPLDGTPPPVSAQRATRARRRPLPLLSPPSRPSTSSRSPGMAHMDRRRPRCCAHTIRDMSPPSPNPYTPSTPRWPRWPPLFFKARPPVVFLPIVRPNVPQPATHPVHPSDIDSLRPRPAEGAHPRSRHDRLRPFLLFLPFPSPPPSVHAPNSSSLASPPLSRSARHAPRRSCHPHMVSRSVAVRQWHAPPEPSFVPSSNSKIPTPRSGHLFARCVCAPSPPAFCLLMSIISEPCFGDCSVQAETGSSCVPSSSAGPPSPIHLLVLCLSSPRLRVIYAWPRPPPFVPPRNTNVVSTSHCPPVLSLSPR
ncbi:hypothetical protein OF83DRAFT_873286 [Amylostereum chailletii]|nr:hypothetical protein OF83DRAFT_873286 [Amylostereum chailletii]